MAHAVKNKPSMLNGMIYKNTVIKPKRVIQLSMDGADLSTYLNCSEASRISGVCQRNIHQVANMSEYKSGKSRKQAGGFIWKFK